MNDNELWTAQLRGARVGAFAEIRDIKIPRAQFELQGLVGDGGVLTYDLEVSPVAQRLDGLSDAFVVQVVYQLRISNGSSSDDVTGSKVAEAEFVVAALFALDVPEDAEAVSDEELDAYAQTTGQFAMYPFAREFVYDLTRRMGLPPLTVAVTRLPAAPPDAVDGD
jgi:hypothetical protein